MNLHLNRPTSLSDKNRKVVALYPNKFIELSMIFNYGTDFRRSSNVFYISTNLVKIVKVYNSLTFIILIIILCFARRMLHLRRDGMISCAFDVLVALIGGYDITPVHRFETIFFGSLFLSSIITSVIGPNALLYPSFMNPDRGLHTFEKLTMQNSPIFISPTLKEYEEIIIEMLKCVQK